MKKLIAFDLDGTLLRNDKTISEYTAHVLSVCRKEGHILAVATGRPPRDVRALLPSAFDGMPLICYNGALIEDCGRRIFSRTIGRDTALDALELAERAGLRQVLFEIDDVLHSNFDPAEIWEGAGTLAEDLRALSFDGVHKVIACGGQEKISRFAASLPDSVSASVTDGNVICQIAAKGVSKAQGLRLIARMHGFSMQDVIAFGDDANDIGMLQASGTGVAMENAPPAVRAAAAYTAKSNEEDGAAAFLNSCFLK